MSTLRVAIIGAGSAGLAMCQCLTNETNIDHVVYERASWIGGTWRYTKEDMTMSGINTPMYKNLRTNLPKEVMQFPDFGFPEHLPSFVSTEEVGKYLQNYALHFDLEKYIRLENEVVSVKPRDKKEEKQTWEVVVRDLRNNTTERKVFDAVVVCNGHYKVPRFPEIPGLDRFPGRVIHSVDYDKPEDFKDETVAILGGRSSGTDICLDLSKFSKNIYFIHLGQKSCTKYPENVEEIIGTITACSSDSYVEIDSNNRRRVSAIIFCTGYQYSFPFLDAQCRINVYHNPKRVTPLFNHVFSIHYPSMSFIGLLYKISPLPVAAIQAQWITSVLTGRTTLPSEVEMVESETADYQRRLQAGIKMHELGVDLQLEYCEMIAALADVPCTFTLVMQSLYSHINSIRATNLATYKDKNFVIEGDHWKEI